jgi:hypothetical protein
MAPTIYDESVLSWKPFGRSDCLWQIHRGAEGVSVEALQTLLVIRESQSMLKGDREIISRLTDR